MAKVAHVFAVAFGGASGEANDPERKVCVGCARNGTPLLAPRRDEILGGAGVASLVEDIAAGVDAAVATGAPSADAIVDVVLALIIREDNDI